MSALIPQRARRRIRHFRLRRVFSGDYGTWAAARAASRGYDDQAVLQKVVAATREVAAGRALWERDGVAFQNPGFNEPLLAALKEIAVSAGDRLDVVDFGGALGSTWWQHRPALRGISPLRWRVVEQPHFVQAGAEFADGVISFHATLREAAASEPRTAVLFSGVLQYLEDPAALLEEAMGLGFHHLLVDRTSFAPDGTERIVVQQPPAPLGGAYPCRLFDRERWLALLAPRYAVRAEWVALDDYPGVDFRGFHLTRKS
ncbi:MAG: methyltransferase, TIGR04325 family [Verrucomicrobia bacterium]|nr:methyltransferase, TIGR04325 family [Verrucomicrobiota bacterium]